MDHEGHAGDCRDRVPAGPRLFLGLRVDARGSETRKRSRSLSVDHRSNRAPPRPDHHRASGGRRRLFHLGKTGARFHCGKRRRTGGRDRRSCATDFGAGTGCHADRPQFDRRSALRQHVLGRGAGILCGWPDRGDPELAGQDAGPARCGAHLLLRLQGHQPADHRDCECARRGAHPGRIGASRRRDPAHYSPANSRERWFSPLVGNLRPDDGRHHCRTGGNRRPDRPRARHRHGSRGAAGHDGGRHELGGRVQRVPDRRRPGSRRH